MKSKSLFAGLAMLIFCAPAVYASSLDMNLSGDAVRLDYAFPVAGPGLESDIGYLHTQDRGNVGQLGLLLVDDAAPDSSSLQVGVGGRLFLVDGPGSGTSGEALAIGGKFRYTLPSYNRFAISGHLFYAPGIVSFSDIDRYTEVGLRANYRVLRQADVYIGYRHVNADFTNFGSSTMDSGLNIGLEIRF